MVEGNTGIEGLLELSEFSHPEMVLRALTAEWGALGLCGDHDVMEQVRRDGTLSGVVTFADHWDAYDRIVDSASVSNDPELLTSIKLAIDAGAVSIFVNATIEAGPFTIASGDNVQRIVGKDADTTEVPVDITCDKDDVTFEQLGFNDKFLFLSADRLTVQDCLLTAAGQIRLAGENYNTIRGLRSLLPSSGNSAIRFTGSPGQLRITGALLHLSAGSGAEYWTTFDAATTARDFSWSDSLIVCSANGGLNLTTTRAHFSNLEFLPSESLNSGRRQLRLFSIAGSDINTTISNCRFRGNVAADVLFECASADADAAGLTLISNLFIEGTILGSQGALWISNNMTGCTIDFQSKTGIKVLGGDMTGATLSNIPADIVFRDVKGQDDRGDYLPVDGAVDLGADAKRFAELWLSGNADIEGDLQLDGNIAVDGTLASGAQTVAGNVSVSGDVSLVDNKKLILGTGGDMEIYFDGLGGVIDMVGAVVLLDLIGTLKADKLILEDNERLELGTASDATLFYDGTDLQVNARAVGTGGMVLKGDLLPQADDTYDLGSATKEWQTLFIDGTANIDTLNATRTGNLIPIVDSVSDLGTTSLRWQQAYLDAIDVGGSIVVGGLVDGEDIAAIGAASHAAGHTAASHSDQGATGAELETLTSAGDASALHGHGTYTDEVFLQPVFHVNAAQSSTGDIPFVLIDDTQKMHFTWMLPTTWVSTTSIHLIMYPNTTETIVVDFSISSLAEGETAGANQAVNNNQGRAVTADQVTAWPITGFVPTGSAGDVLMVRLDSDTADIRVLGLKIVFVRSQA